MALGSRPARCHTSGYGTGPDDDLRFARQLCEALGMPHVTARTPENEDVVRSEQEKNELINFQALEHGWVWLLAQDMADGEAVTYDGIAGDVLSARHFHDHENSRLYRVGRYDEVGRRLARLTSLLTPAEWREAAAATDPCAAMVKELVRYRDTQNPMMFSFCKNGPGGQSVS